MVCASGAEHCNSTTCGVLADFLQQIDAVAAENDRGREPCETCPEREVDEVFDQVEGKIPVFADDHEDLVEHLIEHRDADCRGNGGEDAGTLVLCGKREREESAEEACPREREAVEEDRFLNVLQVLRHVRIISQNPENLVGGKSLRLDDGFDDHGRLVRDDLFGDKQFRETVALPADGVGLAILVQADFHRTQFV